jgi:RNA polymerase sigma factor (sigma-70 family)
VEHSPLTSILDLARRLGGPPGCDSLPDGELLRRFVAGDAVACEQLLRRHGPMVYGVCRRVLRDAHAADDAFQATFLLLVRKAGSLRRPERLGPWLHGVAYRTALQARTRSRRRREEALTEAPATDAPPADDLRPVLDAAIDRLPARERTAVVLCYLEGVTYADAAQRLRCPLGTLAARLARARDRLRVRLTRQGLAPAAGLLTAGLAADAPALPPMLVAGTVRLAIASALGATAEVVPETVLSLMQGVRRMMLLHTCKIALAAGLVFGLTGTGVGVIAYRTAAAQVPVPVGPAKPVVPPAPPANPAKDADQPQAEERSIPLTLLRQNPPESYLVDAGDLLGIFIEGILGERGQTPPLIQAQSVPGAKTTPPAVGYPIPVQESGTLLLPLLDPLPVRGRSMTEVQQLITKTYVDKGLLIQGSSRVLVNLVRPRTYHVTVVRHDGGPNITALDLEAYENDVLSALARSGGLPGSKSNNTVVIQRRRAGVGQEEIRIPLRMRPDQTLPFQLGDVVLRDGDVVLIESRDLAPAPERDVTTGGLPAGTPPVMTLAVAAPDGRILVQVPGVAGAALAWRWQLFGTQQLKASETDGKPIDGKALAERLQKMAAVLVATDGRPADALYLQAVKPGTPVLVLQGMTP